MKIAFVGASGYGNIGDDTYPLVFRAHLPEHELVFFNSDLPPELPRDIDLVVMGGGGVIYNGISEPGEESPHFPCMKFYLESAVTAGIPFGFLSCGFQFRDQLERLCAQDLTPWQPYLKQARFITVRSPNCARIANELGARSDAAFFPDAAYLFAPNAEAEVQKQNMLTIVPAGTVNATDQFLCHFIKPFRSIGWRIVWLRMGAAIDDDALLQEARELFPDSVIVNDVTPADAFRQIASSRFVMSGRYHGMVFARRSGVPFYVPTDAPYKIRREDLTVNHALAIGHIHTLRSCIGRM